MLPRIKPRSQGTRFQASSLEPGTLCSSRGFTLIEVLVAVIILAFGLVLVVEGMAKTEQAFRISENKVTASLMAEEKTVESEILVRQRHSLNASSDSEKENIVGRVFEWKREIDPFFHPTVIDETKLNQVDVTVKWNDGPVRKNTQTFSTIILNREKAL